MWYHVSREKWDKDYIGDLRAPREEGSQGESRALAFAWLPPSAKRFSAYLSIMANGPYFTFTRIRSAEPYLAAMLA